jgi:SAM-dependent methyltransferase
MSPHPDAYDLREVANAVNYNSWVIDRARQYLRGRILDFGAGIGTFAIELRRESPDVVALEPDPDLAAVLRQSRPELQVVEDASLLEGPFDAIISFNVIEHIEDDDEALRRMRELLAPQGTAVLLTPAHPWLFGSLDVSFGHQRRYTVEGLRTQLVQAGLTPLELRYVNPVGALGWLLAGRVRRATAIPKTELRLFDRAVPLLRSADRLRLPLGLSVWAAAARR